ncbi:uncharacterized protein LOC125500131 [Athalia rosae]|uniref:uncharacterized protein LOC125500131 n=1 Tax=Athalia rosae TaxID=37344 RepID=UPI0020339F33|nr:uncharacterized protein LOC125500131 [Athalia rosae]
MAMMKVRISLWILIVSAKSLSEVSSISSKGIYINVSPWLNEKSKLEHAESTTGDFSSTALSSNTDQDADPQSYLGSYLIIGGAVLATIVVILIIVIVIVRVFRKRKQKYTPYTYDDPFDRIMDDLEYHYYDEPKTTGCDNANSNCDENALPNQEIEVIGRCRELPDLPDNVNSPYTEMN